MMSVNSVRKERPLSMRLPEADLAVIDRAAQLRGSSRTEFMRDAAVRAAEHVIMEDMPIRMTGEGFESFLEAINAPAKASEVMVEVLRRPAPWESDDHRKQ